MPLNPGQRFGAYEILALLGSGGMGEVYRAHDSRLKRDVALKILQTNDEDHRRRLEREAHTIAALNHPNIVTIHSVEEVGSTPFLTMELVEGQPLNALIPPGGMPLEMLRNLAMPIAEALAAAHKQGVIHRDLKPANIMVRPDGRVKVLDFGIAKTLPAADQALATVEQTGPVPIGTLAYMSPEQAAGRSLDERTDIFSFGIVLYEMASGRRPFQGPNAAAVLVALLNRPAAAIPGIDPGLQRVISRAMAREPGARYQRAEDLLVDLQALGTPTGPVAAPIAPRTTGPSIAVLPFANLSADPDQEYFCDGMAEELISALARVKGLSVAARTSAFQFKGRSLDVSEIGERLKVQTILEGSVRKMGNRLRITAQLVDVHDGYQLWSERYDRAMDDVFAIQDEIGRAIAESLKVTLSRPPSGPIVRPGTKNLDAYHLCLRGRFLLNRLSGLFESLTAARRCFEEAVALDPEYAAAYAGLSECCNALGYTTFLAAPEASRAALAAAAHAVALDPSMAEAHTALGWTKTLFAIDMVTAEQDFARALELAPGYPPAHGYYALLLVGLGRFDEAMAHAEQARQLDPLWLIMPFIVCMIDVCARRFDRAERQMRELIALDPRMDGTYWYLSSALAGQGRIDEAVQALEPAVEMVHRAPFFLALLGVWYARAGRETDARAVLRELLDGGRCPPVWFAQLYGALGETDEAFECLERAIEEHDDQVSFMAVDHRFDSLRGDPRFAVLLGRLGLPVIPPAAT